MFTELHLLALLTYSGTAALAAVPFLRLGGAGRPVGGLAVWGAAAAVALHFAALVTYGAATGALPVSGLGPALSSLAFLVGLLTLAILWLTREPSIVLVASPLMVGPLAIALLAGFGHVPASPVPEGGWFILHTALSLLGLALLAMAFVAAALYLAQHRELKGRRFGVIFQFVPPLEQLDRLNHLALITGFPALTIGVLLAVGYLRGAGGLGVELVHLSWGLLSWLVLGCVAALRISGRLRGKRAAYASVGGFAAVALTYLILLVISGEGGSRFL